MTQMYEFILDSAEQFPKNLSKKFQHKVSPASCIPPSMTAGKHHSVTGQERHASIQKHGSGKLYFL